MKSILLPAVLLATCFAFGQENKPAPAPENSKPSKGNVTLKGCVDRSNGDFVLIKQNPAMTYELQASGKIRLGSYMGQRVEVTGRESPTLSTSSDSMNRVGSASPVTITVTSIKTIEKECTVR